MNKNKRRKCGEIILGPWITELLSTYHDGTTEDEILEMLEPCNVEDIDGVI